MVYLSAERKKAMYIDTPEVRAIVRQAFPEYNGKRFEVLPFKGPMKLDSYWSGGSRDYYCAVRLTNGQTAPVPENGTPWNPELKELTELPENTVLVQHHHGPYQYTVVYVRPENLNRFALPEPVNLTREQKIVLCATASYKSSYAGIKNYRFSEARSHTGITLEQWEQAKAELITRGLLNKAGAMTDNGRNAIGNTRLESLCDFEHVGGVEPDAENYQCENCGSMTVFGAEQLMIKQAL